jgi:hypothetical protein
LDTAEIARGYQVEADLERLIERRSRNGETDPDEREPGMSYIQSRLKRIEDRSRGVLSCPECGLRSQDKGYIVVDGKDPVPEMPEMCPECGRYTRIHIVVVEEGGGA